MQEGQWEIFHSENSSYYKQCICGHRVKRVSYLYDRNTKQTMCIGTTCVKRKGIKAHLKNRILIQVLKADHQYHDLEERLRTWIQTTYSAFREKINGCSPGMFDYYDIIAPFRRLLNDVCELTTEYDFDLILILKDIERDVESMNESTKHHMIDEMYSDAEGTISIIDDISSISGIRSRCDSASEFDKLDTARSYSEADILPISEFSADTARSYSNVVDTLSISEFSADTARSYSNVVDTLSISEFSADTARSYSEADILPISEFSADTARSYSDTLSISEFSSEFSAETVVEEKQKALPIMVADAHCSDPDCNPNIHCYCELKSRLNRMRLNMIEHRAVIHSVRTELEDLIEKSRTFRLHR